MTDTVYLATNGAHGVVLPLLSGTAINGSATGADTVFCATSIDFANTANEVTLKPFGPVCASAEDGWFHFEYGPTGAANTNTRSMITLVNSSAVDVLRITANGGGTTVWNLQRWNGSSYTTIATFGKTGARIQWDIHVKIDATVGLIEFFADKVSVASYSGDTSALGTSITSARFGNITSFGSDHAYASQILITNFNTLNCKVHQRLFNTPGHDQEWSGSLSDINEAAPDSTTYISTDTNDKINTYSALMQDFTGYIVKAVIPQWSGQRGGTDAPLKWRSVLTINGTKYYNASKTISFGNAAYEDITYINPATGLAWTRLGAGAPGKMTGRSATAGASTGSVTITLPTGWQPFDILILACESQNGQAVAAPDATWTEMTNSPVTGASQTRLTVFWKRATATETDPVVADPGDHLVCELMAISGAIMTGDPWASTAAGFDTTASAAATWPSVTPSAIEYGIVNIVSRGTDSAAEPISSITMPSTDANTKFGSGLWGGSTAGDGGGVQIYFALASAATAIQSTGTMATTDHKAMLSAVLIPRTSPLLEVGIQARAT